jgi:hypothetical protein
MTHINPNCRNAKKCKPHGESGPVEYREQVKRSRKFNTVHSYTATPNIAEILEQHNHRVDIRNWVILIVGSIIIGVVLGNLLKILF